MKNIILTLLAIITVAVSSTASAQEQAPSPWSLAAVHTFRDKQWDRNWALVVSNRVDTLPEAFGIKKLTLDLSLFAGTGANQTPVGGSVGFSFKLAQNVRLGIGLGLQKDAGDLGAFFENGFRDIRPCVAASLIYTRRF